MMLINTVLKIKVPESDFDVLSSADNVTDNRMRQLRATISATPTVKENIAAGKLGCSLRRRLFANQTKLVTNVSWLWSYFEHLISWIATTQGTISAAKSRTSIWWWVHYFQYFTTNSVEFAKIVLYSRQIRTIYSLRLIQVKTVLCDDTILQQSGRFYLATFFCNPWHMSTLKQVQVILTFATVAKNSDWRPPWKSMRKDI